MGTQKPTALHRYLYQGDPLVSSGKRRLEQAGGDQETSERKDTRMTAQRFLVPVDFSEDANQALEYAIGLASKLGARVTLLHVIQPPPWGGADMDVTFPYAYSLFIQHLEAEVAHSMQACLERVTAGGLEGEVAVVRGVPFRKF